MLDGFNRNQLAGGVQDGDLAKPTPGIQRRVAEELIDRAVILGAATLDGVVHDALAFVDGRVAGGLHLELIDSVD